MMHLDLRSGLMLSLKHVVLYSYIVIVHDLLALLILQVERAEFDHPMQSSTVGKREAERMIRKANREKRFVSSDIQVIQLDSGDCVQFSDK